MSAALFMGLILILAAPAGTVSPAGQDYLQAREQARAGQPERALELLGQLVQRWPDDAFADDALAERARILEQDLKDPERALVAWRELATRFPDSRMARRARARITYLQAHLDQGGQVLAAYQDLMRRGLKLPVDRAVADMDALLRAHPDFSLRGEGRMFMAGLLARDGQVDRARRELERVVAEHEGERTAGLARTQLGQLALDQNDLDAAEHWYGELASMPDADWGRAGAEGLARVNGLRWRSRLMTSALGVWGLALLAGLLGLVLLMRRKHLAARRLWPPPAEAIVYALVMGILVGIVWGRAAQTTWALAWMAALLAPVVLINGWLLRGLRLRTGRLTAWCLALVLVFAAATYAAVALAGMTDQVLHTLRFGSS